MDQLKEILRQAIIYRFWIAVGLSALLPMIAYFVGVGPVQTKAAAETAAIIGADKDVKKYTSGDLPNVQYKPAVQTKTDELSNDVDVSWRKLYARQAPLLTWPVRVDERFRKWGRKWPENVNSGAVRLAVTDYVEAYPAAVTSVYNSFKPFDVKDGTGIVSAPPEAALLRPASFTIESLPDLGKVWAAQERLWIQRTLLEVVAEVNKSAKNWDGAIIKQVNLIEVGSPMAQDQRSLVKGEVLEAAPEIKDPSKPVDAAAAPAAEAGGGGGGRMMPGMMMAGGGAASSGEDVSYIKVDSDQFKELPVEMVVLIEQDRIQDYLIALANSPMTIQVMDFEMSKPEVRVTKPEKGVGLNFGGMGGMGGMMMSGGMMGYGGNAARMRMMSGEAGAGAGGYGGAMMQGSMMMGMRGQGGGTAPTRKGVDKRSENLAEKAKEQEKKARETKAASLQDPFYNVVEVKIFGKARFFNPPPAEAPVEPSQAQAAAPPAVEGEKKDEAEAKKTDAEKTTEPQKKDEPEKKAEAEKKTEGEPKADAEKKPEVEKKAEAEKKTEGEAKPDSEKKSEAPKSETPKTEGAEPATPKR